MSKYLFVSFFVLLFLAACAPQRDDDFMLGSEPAAPEFALQMVEGDSNRFVYTDLSDGNLHRLWTFEEGIPKTSTAASDTVFFPKQGTWTVSLGVTKLDGSGTAFTNERVTILNNAPLACIGKLELLTGCEAGGKCWTFTRAAQAVKVGPVYGDWSWFTSPVDGLQDAQYDDDFCFTFTDFVYENRNKGVSVDPWQGFAPVPITFEPGEFEFNEGAGTGGLDQLIVPNDQFMGVMNADNVFDVRKLTQNELIIAARFADQEGEPEAEGWFELTFEAR